MERRSIAPRRLHTYTRTYTHIYTCVPFTNPLYPDWSRDLSLFCPICSSVSVYYPLQHSLFCTRSRVCEGGIIGIMLRWPSKGCEGETERESRTSSYRSATPHVPSPSFGHGCTVRMALSHPLFLRSRARICPLIEQYRQNRHEEGRTDRDNVQRDGTERERVSRKGLFTPLEMWNSCWPRIRRIKSL